MSTSSLSPVYLIRASNANVLSCDPSVAKNELAGATVNGPLIDTYLQKYNVPPEGRKIRIEFCDEHASQRRGEELPIHEIGGTYEPRQNRLSIFPRTMAQTDTPVERPILAVDWVVRAGLGLAVKSHTDSEGQPVHIRNPRNMYGWSDEMNGFTGTPYANPIAQLAANFLLGVGINNMFSVESPKSYAVIAATTAMTSYFVALQNRSVSVVSPRRLDPYVRQVLATTAAYPIVTSPGLLKPRNAV